MSVTKYPVLDDDFLIKMLGACSDDEERGLITVLDLSGMHISSLCVLDSSSMIRQGSRTYIRWVRPKTNKTLQALVPKENAHSIENFLKMRRKSRQYYHFLVKKIGEKAGYQDVSPMTGSVIIDACELSRRKVTLFLRSRKSWDALLMLL